MERMKTNFRRKYMKRLQSHPYMKECEPGCFYIHGKDYKRLMDSIREEMEFESFLVVVQHHPVLLQVFQEQVIQARKRTQHIRNEIKTP